MTLIVSMIILYIYRFSSSIESIECIHCFMTIQFFFFFFLELFKIYRTKGKRRYEEEIRACNIYSLFRDSIVEILSIPWLLIPGDFTIPTHHLFFFFFLLLSFFISPPFPLFTSRRPRERPRRDLKVSITVYNNYRCFKKIWLLSLFRPVYCALHFFFTFQSCLSIDAAPPLPAKNQKYQVFGNRRIFHNFLNKVESFDSNLFERTKSSKCLFSNDDRWKKFPRYSKQYFTLSLSLSFRREKTKRKALDKKYPFNFLDNFVTRVENGVVISQRIAHSFNIVSSIVFERWQWRRQVTSFSFTIHGEEEVSRFLSSSNLLPSITSFHAVGGHSPRRRRRRRIVCRSMPWQNRRYNAH